jgi:acyl carrier protein
MPDLEERLASCFSVVFPDLNADEIKRASNTSVATWDSLATVTLISLIEEEFKLSLPPDDFEYLVSFDLTADCLKRRTGNGS